MEKDISLAQQLLQLLKEHKESCNSPDCGISLSQFRPLYEDLIGRKSNEEEDCYLI